MRRSGSESGGANGRSAASRRRHGRNGRQDDTGFGAMDGSVRLSPSAFDMKICAICRKFRIATNDDPAFVGGPEMMNEVLRRSDYVVISMQRHLRRSDASIGGDLA
jgi:hypothetical protein